MTISVSSSTRERCCSSISKIWVVLQKSSIELRTYIMLLQRFTNFNVLKIERNLANEIDTAEILIKFTCIRDKKLCKLCVTKYILFK